MTYREPSDKRKPVERRGRKVTGLKHSCHDRRTTEEEWQNRQVGLASSVGERARFIFRATGFPQGARLIERGEELRGHDEF